MSEEHRTKIANSQILKRLIDAAEGKLELTPVQAQVGLALMKKVFPDLQSIAHTGENGGPVEIVTKTQRDAAVNAALRADT